MVTTINLNVQDFKKFLIQYSTDNLSKLDDGKKTFIRSLFDSVEEDTLETLKLINPYVLGNLKNVLCHAILNQAFYENSKNDTVLEDLPF